MSFELQKSGKSVVLTDGLKEGGEQGKSCTMLQNGVQGDDEGRGFHKKFTKISTGCPGRTSGQTFEKGELPLV